jgi:hypothetical protein
LTQCKRIGDIHTLHSIITELNNNNTCQNRKSPYM